MSKSKNNLKDTAYEYIKTRIINGEYAPKEKIDDTIIAEELNISKTPIRDAIQLLVSQNFLVSSPKIGTTVTEINISDIYQLYEPMARLQGLAAKTACLCIKKKEIDDLKAINERVKLARDTKDHLAQLESDMEFHQYILNVANNPYISKFCNELFMQMQRIEYLFLNSVISLPDSYSVHNDIIKAFSKKDPEAAEFHMSENWLNSIPDVNIEVLAKLITSLK